jgi:hypothetical protein
MQDRQTERASVRWTVQYQRYRNREWSLPDEALCLNVGGYGMLLVLSEAVSEGEVLRLHMKDVMSGLPFTLARIQWTRRAPDRVNVLVGIEYVDSSDVAATA